MCQETKLLSTHQSNLLTLLSKEILQMHFKNAVKYEVFAASNSDKNLLIAGQRTELVEKDALEL